MRKSSVIRSLSGRTLFARPTSGRDSIYIGSVCRQVIPNFSGQIAVPPNITLKRLLLRKREIFISICLGFLIPYYDIAVVSEKIDRGQGGSPAKHFRLHTLPDPQSQASDIVITQEPFHLQENCFVSGQQRLQDSGAQDMR